MLLVAAVAGAERAAPSSAEATGLAKLKVVRSTLPAVTHVDLSARIQTVDPERHPRFHRLLEAFEERTGCPVLINTSFNVRGEPIVCSPEEAYRCFQATDMDVLVVEDLVLRKEEQPALHAVPTASFLARFQPD